MNNARLAVFTYTATSLLLPDDCLSHATSLHFLLTFSFSSLSSTSLSTLSFLYSIAPTHTPSGETQRERDFIVKDWKGRLQTLLARRYRGVLFEICYDAPKSAVSTPHLLLLSLSYLLLLSFFLFPLYCTPIPQFSCLTFLSFTSFSLSLSSPSLLIPLSSFVS